LAVSHFLLLLRNRQADLKAIGQLNSVSESAIGDYFAITCNLKSNLIQIGI